MAVTLLKEHKVLISLLKQNSYSTEREDGRLKSITVMHINEKLFLAEAPSHRLHQFLQVPLVLIWEGVFILSSKSKDKHLPLPCSCPINLPYNCQNSQLSTCAKGRPAQRTRVGQAFAIWSIFRAEWRSLPPICLGLFISRTMSFLTF